MEYRPKNTVFRAVKNIPPQTMFVDRNLLFCFQGLGATATSLAIRQPDLLSSFYFFSI